ncbi:hypothetical protein ACQVP2_11405 [Methylobacterium aquaticum]|uniref:Uncharacterized protein n=1 Tax=Methylobacterium aquaticum TaxID=270351 RepID=A0A0J6VGV1_9HYPH|nr:hypothetical protein [Methylobacterium aquaticum]KMO38291.1 hypothetical protein VP06_06400 [Methylobacterium aquaticum]
MALTNADFRRMVAESRGGVRRPLPPLTLPDRVPHRFEPASRISARFDIHDRRGQDVRREDVRRQDLSCEDLRHHDVRTIEIVWATAPVPSRSRFLGGLSALAKVLALPVLFAGSLYAQPAYECHKQKSLGMLYYGTTVQMCVTERVAERVGTVQAFLDRQMRGM